MTNNERSFASLSLRELFLVTTIVAMILGYVFFKKSDSVTRVKNSNSLVSELGPMEFRYWRQVGSSGSGTGQMGSGNEWISANGIEIYSDFIVIHQESGLKKMIDRNGLTTFDWRPRKPTPSPAAKPVSSH